MSPESHPRIAIDSKALVPEWARLEREIIDKLNAAAPEFVARYTRPDGSLAVDYEKLGALAFAAVGELTTLVQTLTARVEVLEAK